MTTAQLDALEVYTAGEVAKILRCNRETVYRWIKEGRLKSCDRHGTRPFRFTREHIDEFLSGPKPAAAPAPKPARHPRYSK